MFSLTELADAFSLERINKAGAKFDVKKAQWFNEQYIKLQNPVSLAADYLPKLPADQGLAFVHLFLDRITFPQDLAEKVAEFQARPAIYDEVVLASKWNADAAVGLQFIAQALPGVDSWEPEGIKHAIHEVLEANGIKMGKVMQILRVALSGNGAGPDLMISMQLWGKAEVIDRLSLALAKFPAL
jgi:glutamyl-tRNA synthetase